MAQKKATDPARTLALLWGSQSNTGRSGLSIRGIIEAAITLVSQKGAEALSMRAVAEQLEVGTMSLYTHIPSKEDLIALMVDHVVADMYSSVDSVLQHSADWREGLRYIAEQNWLLHRRHPWILQLTPARPIIGPYSCLKYEAELRPLEGLGLNDIEMDSILSMILTHVEGCARTESMLEKDRRETGESDLEWWISQESILSKWANAKQFPVGTRVGQSVGEAFQTSSNPEHILHFGLEYIIVGIEKLLER